MHGVDRRLVRAWAASVGVVTVPFWGVIAGRETAIYGDLRDHHLANVTWAAERWFSGRLPDWGAWAFAGQNVIGAGQSAPFHPSSLIFGVLPTRHAFQVWLVLHLWLTATGAFIWSWRTWRSRPAAMVSAIAYGLNGFIVMHLMHMNLLLGAAWLPWCMLGLDLLVERWSPRNLVALVLPVAMIGLAGHPQTAWIALVGLGIYGVVRVAALRPDLRALGRLAFGVAAGVGLAAVALVPQARFAGGSVRDESTMEWAFTFAAPPESLVTTIFPGALGGTHDVPGATGDWRGESSQQETATHVGIVVLMLAAIGVVVRRRDRRVIALVLLSLFALGTALAEHSPLAPLVHDTVPFASSFRAWSRNLVLLNLAAAMLAGAGVTALATLSERARRRAVAMTAVSVLVVVDIAIVSGLGGSIAPRGAFVGSLVVPLVSLGGALWAVAQWQRRTRLALVVLLLTCSLDATVFAIGAPWRREGLSASATDEFFTGAGFAAIDAPGGLDRWATNDPDLLPLATVADAHAVDGYDPLLQRDFADVVAEQPSGTPLDDRLWAPGWYPDVLRTTTVLLRDEAPSDPDWREADAPPDSLLVEYQRSPRLPDAYLAGSVTPLSIADTPAALLDTSTDLRRTTYVLDEQIDAVGHLLDTAPTPIVTVDGSIGLDGTATFGFATDRDALLVVSIAFLDGWTATVDGRPVEVVRTNGLVIGVPVPAGARTVRLEFVTPGLHLGALVSLVSLLLVAAAAATTSLTSRRRGSGRRPSRRS